MAPRTRSANTASTSDATSGTDTPSTTPGRKVPHCTKCKKPRVGHPRSGCPFVDSPAGSPDNSPRRRVNESALTTPSRRSLASNNLADALGSMQIRSSTPRGTDEATRRQRRRSQPLALRASANLHSLSGSSNEIVEMLMKPGILDEDTEPEDNAPPTFMVKGKPGRIIRWEGSLQAQPMGRPKASPQSPMPGTLYTPNPSFFESQTSAINVKQEEKLRILDNAPNASHASQTFSQPPSVYKPKPLVHTISSDQRNFFVSQLGDSSKATIHVLPKVMVEEIAEEARELGLLADILMNDDEEDSQAVLVVGRNDNEMDRLIARVELAGQGKLQEPYVEQTPSGGSRLRAVAGGAVAGAVGAWAGLAFT